MYFLISYQLRNEINKQKHKKTAEYLSLYSINYEQVLSRFALILVYP